LVGWLVTSIRFYILSLLRPSSDENEWRSQHGGLTFILKQIPEKWKKLLRVKVKKESVRNPIKKVKRKPVSKSFAFLSTNEIIHFPLFSPKRT
jgi:hypothetical protein